MVDANEGRVMPAAESSCGNEGSIDTFDDLRGGVSVVEGLTVYGRDRRSSGADKPENTAHITMIASESCNIGSISDRGEYDEGASFASSPLRDVHAANGLEKPMRCLSAYNLFYQFARDKIVGGEADFDFRTLTPEMVDESASRSIGRKRNWRKHRASHGKVGFEDLAKAIASWWRGLDPSVKALFKARAQIEKEKYVDALAEWKKAGGGAAKAGRGRKNAEQDPIPPQHATKEEVFLDPYSSPDQDQASKMANYCIPFVESVPKSPPLDDSPGISPIHFEPFVVRACDPLLPYEHQHSHLCPTQQLLPVRLSMSDLQAGSAEMLPPDSSVEAFTNDLSVVTPSFDRPSLQDPSMTADLSHFLPANHVVSHDHQLASLQNTRGHFDVNGMVHEVRMSVVPESLSTVFRTDIHPHQMHFGNYQSCSGQPHLPTPVLHPAVYPMYVSSQHPWQSPESYAGIPLQSTLLSQPSTTNFLSPTPQSNFDQQIRAGSVFRYF